MENTTQHHNVTILIKDMEPESKLPSNQKSYSVLYKCNICCEKFSSLSEIKPHMDIHISIKHHKCTECGMQFRQPIHLASHVKTMHLGEKPHKCAKCGKAFINSVTLDAHMKVHEAEKPFKCPTCGECFPNTDRLNAHINTHKIIYKCNYCFKEYLRLINLQKHIKTHGKEKRFRCPHCGEGFSDISELFSHRRSHVIKKVLKCSNCDNQFVDLPDAESNEKMPPCPVCGQEIKEAISTRAEGSKKAGIRLQKYFGCGKVVNETRVIRRPSPYSSGQKFTSVLTVETSGKARPPTILRVKPKVETYQYEVTAVGVEDSDSIE